MLVGIFKTNREYFFKMKNLRELGKDFIMPFKSCSGVIQGGVLNPQLFNAFQVI